MFPKALLNTVLLALVLAANPAFALFKTPIIKKYASGKADILQHDQARAGRFATSSSINTPATNRAVSYIATVGIGSPPTNCTLLRFDWLN